MSRIDFNNNRGENLSDPIYDKDAVNKRTLKRHVQTAEGSYLSTISGGTVNGGISATTISACTGIYTSNLYGCSPLVIHDNTSIDGNLTISGNTSMDGNLTISGNTTTVGARFKKVREITITNGSWSGVGEPESINGDDEIVFVTDNTVGGIPAAEFNIDLSNFIDSSSIGRVVEIVNVDSGSAGLFLGAYVQGIVGGGFTTYTINGVTGTPIPLTCGAAYQSITIVKRADKEIVYYGTGL